MSHGSSNQATATKATPRRLATPTDLKPDVVQAISDAVNPLVADAFALYLKTKNYHWHLTGPKFRDLHLLFDEHAEAILGTIDLLAERVRKIGGTSLRSIGHVSRIQTLSDDNDEYVPTSEMVRRLLADNRHMAEDQRAAIETCESRGDTPTANILQEVLDQTERRVWFLYELSLADD